MSKIHLLEKRNKHYRAILHVSTPLGNNAGNKAWSDILVATEAQTSMAEGTGPGHISKIEAEDIAAGEIMEIVVSLPVEADEATPVSLNEMADSIIRDKIQELQSRYKYYGYEQ